MYLDTRQFNISISKLFQGFRHKMASHVTNILLIQYATSVTLTTDVFNFRNHYISPLNPTTQYFLSNFLLAFSKNTRKKKTEFRLPRSRGEEHGEGSEAPQGGALFLSPSCSSLQPSHPYSHWPPGMLLLLWRPSFSSHLQLLVA